MAIFYREGFYPEITVKQDLNDGKEYALRRSRGTAKPAVEAILSCPNKKRENSLWSVSEIKNKSTRAHAGDVKPCRYVSLVFVIIAM